MIKEFFEALNWRYATKRMNGTKVSNEKVHNILEAARLAPTLAGLQPYHIVVVSDQEKLDQIAPIAFNQPQISKASHLLVFAAWNDITADHINENFDRTGRERNLPEGALDTFRNGMLGNFGGMTTEAKAEIAARQAFIGLGFALAAAAIERVDATPMAGFNGPALDTFLGIDQKGLRSVAIMPIGYRDAETDPIVNMKKVRFAKEHFVIEG